MSTSGPIDIARLLEGDRSSPLYTQIIIWSLALMFVEGYDMQTMAYAAPAIIRDWHVDKALFGPVFSASLVGYLIGALVVSNISDRIGRKSTLIGGALVFGLFTLATPLATDLTTLMVLRVLAGIGLGGTVPSIIALNAEFVPERARGTRITLLYIGYTAGTALGGFIASYTIPHWGWGSVFVIGGILPLLLVLGAASQMPESVRFLAVSGRAPARLAAIAARLRPDLGITPATRFTTTEGAARGVPVRHLFAGGRAVMTTLLWATFILSLVGHYFLMSWLPTVLQAGGLPLQDAVIAGALFMTGGLVGTILSGIVLDRWGGGAVAMIFIAATPLIIGIGFAQHAETLLMILVFLAGVALIGGQGGLNALSGILYPTQARSTGAGWALGVGRIGSIFGPVVGGLMIGAHLSPVALFTWASVPAMLCGGTLLLVMRTRPDATPAGLPAAAE